MSKVFNQYLLFYIINFLCLFIIISDRFFGDSRRFSNELSLILLFIAILNSISVYSFKSLERKMNKMENDIKNLKLHGKI